MTGWLWPGRAKSASQFVDVKRPFGSAQREESKRNSQRQVMAGSAHFSACPYTALHCNRKIRIDPISTIRPISSPMIQSGMGLPVAATNPAANMTPRFANTSFAEKM